MRRRLVLFALVGLIALLSACATPSAPRASDAQDHVTAKQGDGTLRTDLAPIAERYPRLASAESIQWMSGTTGTSGVGPSTYWVDVVAVIPQSDLEALRATADIDTVPPPELVPGMQAAVPAGPFEGGSALDELFSSPGYSATVALNAGTRTVVLSGLFE